MEQRQQENLEKRRKEQLELEQHQEEKQKLRQAEQRQLEQQQEEKRVMDPKNWTTMKVGIRL